MILRSFPPSLAVLLVVIALVNALAGEYFWYWQMRWFDMPMHFAGGAWIAGVAIWWKFFSKGVAPVPVSFARLALWGIGGALVVGLGWEVYESTVSFFIEGHINDILDTASDLVFDVLGGLAVAGTVFVLQRER